jgi:hypothetical protein
MPTKNTKVHAMPSLLTTPASMLSTSRRLRPSSAGMQGGASSMLRLARVTDTRLPTGNALSSWAERAATMLDLTPMMVGPQSHAAASATSPRGAR